METIENLTRTTVSEIVKVLNTRTVVGEPTTIDGRTIIPLVTIGFGFGAGGTAKGETKQRAEGEGGGTGGGAWIRPVAVVIIDEKGVRVEPVRGGWSTALERIGETIPEMIEKYLERREELKKEG